MSPSPRERTSYSTARLMGTPSRCPTGEIKWRRMLPEKVQLRCLCLRWFLSNAIVPGNHGTLLRLDGIDRSQNGAIVKCEVSNAIGKSEETQTLDINCEYIVQSVNISC